MSLADDLTKLDDLRRSGALTEEEFARAKEALLNAPAPAAPPSAEPLAEHLSAQLEEVQFQNELAQLDREWEREREKYMVVGKYGQRYMPTTGGSAIGGFVIVGFGVVWTLIASVMAFGANQAFSDHEGRLNAFSIIPCAFPVFGLLFITFGIVLSVQSHKKAGEYRQAEQVYRRKREEIHARFGRR